MSKTNCINQSTNCCESCQPPLQQNCSCEPCSPISVQCTADINNAVCVPILADQIYDCVTIDKEQCAFTGITFTVSPISTTGVTVFTGSEPICITGVRFNYDYIGLLGAGVTVASGYADTFIPGATSTFIDGNLVNLVPSTVSCIGLTGTTGATFATSLYNQATATISRNRCCCNNSTATSSKARIIERALVFYVCNPSIDIVGSIACTPFVGTAKLVGPSATGHANNPVSVTLLGFDPITICGRLCLPLSARRIDINENFNACLQAECITPVSITSTAAGTTLFADAELNLVISKQILATVQEQIAVFTTPDAVICKSGSAITPCPPGITTI